MKGRKSVLACLLSLMLVGLIGNFVPLISEVKALSTSDVIEILDYSTTYTIHGLDCNSTGYVFAHSGNSMGWEILGSSDSGRTWSVCSSGSGSGNVYTIWVDKDDYVWAQVGGNLKKFDKQGKNPSVKWDISSWQWHFTQAPNGSMYTAHYSPNSPYIFGTHDNGENWNVVLNATEHGSTWWHPHSVRADPWTGDLYVCSGDTGNQIEIWKYTESTKSWSRLSQGRWNDAYRGVDLWETDIAFDANYVYLGSDTGEDKITRFQKGQSPWTSEKLVDAEYWTEGTNYVRKLENIDGIFVFCTSLGIVGASWDGEHWIILYDMEASNGRSYSITRRKAKDNSILVDDAGNQKIIKLNIDQDVLRHLFYNGFVSESDNTVTVSQIIRGGTSHVDLSGYVLTDATLKMTGVSHENVFKNSSFEGSGTASQQGWRLSDTRYGMVEINSTEHYHGSKSLKFVVTAGWKGVTTTRFATGTYNILWEKVKNQVLTIHFYAKSNDTKTDGLGVRTYYKNSTHSDYSSGLYSINGTWQTYHSACVLPSWATHYSVIINQKYTGIEIFLDDVQLEFYESTTFESKGRQYAKYGNFTFDANMLNTTNPSLTIAGTQYFHSGTLANNTDSQTWNLGEIGGIIPVSASLEGSGQVKITINGTRQLSSSNILLRSWNSTNDVGHGLYVGTFTITTSQNYLLVLANMTTSNITSATYTISAAQLTFTVSMSPGFASTTKVYCGSKGKPTSVTGVTSWSYDGATKILTLTAIHTGPTTITISWVTEPVTATIDIDPDTLNLKGKGKWITAHIELPEDYDVSDIDVSTVRLNGEIRAELHPTKIGDYDADGVSDLMVRFDRHDVIALLSAGEATLTITGKVNETPFEGTDTIIVIGKRTK